MAITKPWPQSYRQFVGLTEKACASKEAYKPDSVTPALLGGMGQNSPNLWNATRNVLPKLNNINALLPNTNGVYCMQTSDPLGICWNKSFSLLLFWHFTFLKNRVVSLTDLRQDIFTRIKCQELWKIEFKCTRCM